MKFIWTCQESKRNAFLQVYILKQVKLIYSLAEVYLRSFVVDDFSIDQIIRPLPQEVNMSVHPSGKSVVYCSCFYFWIGHSGIMKI